MDVETLQALGLTRGEAEVYLTLIRLGNSSTGNIIKESEVSRSKVYDVLERLKQRGLVSEVIKENVRYFEAADPKRIIDYLKSKKEEIESKIAQSQKVVDEINRVKNTHLVKQEAYVYTGNEGIKTLYNQILDDLEPGEEYLAFGMGKKEFSMEKMSSFIKNFHIKRAEKKVHARIILHDDIKKEMKEFSKIKYYSFKYTSVNVPTNIALWKDHVVNLVWNENPIAFVIKSKEVYTKYKEYFESLWDKK